MLMNPDTHRYCMASPSLSRILWTYIVLVPVQLLRVIIIDDWDFISELYFRIYL